MMLSCKETTRLLSQGEDRGLAFGERVALRVHLAICKGCRNVNAQFKFLRLAVERLARNEEEENSA
jgi:Putative zinc-finger